MDYKKYRTWFFIKNLIICIAVTVGLTAFAYMMEVDNLFRQLESIENRENDIVVERVKKQFEDILSDLYLLSELSSVQRFVEFGNDESLEKLGYDLSNLLKRKKIYQQISYIDEAGNLIVGLKNENGIVSVDNSNKNLDEQAYKSTKNLYKNQIYVDFFDIDDKSLDVNKHNIKFAIGVYDENDKKNGIIVLDYMGDNLLELIDQYSFYQNKSENFILNKNGEFLKVAQTFGEKVLGTKEVKKNFFKKNFPEEWQIMEDAYNGYFFSENGFYVYTTIYPLLEIYKVGRNFEMFTMLVQGGINVRKSSWKLVSHIPLKSIKSLKFEILKKYITLDFSLFAILVLILWILADESMRKKIAENNLMLQNQELRNANNTKDKFFSIIAHDLRTPFTGLLGLMEMLIKKQENFSEERKEKFLNEIYRTLKHTYNLLENLLQWSRLQTQNIDFNPTELRLKDLLQNTMSLLELNASRKEIEMSLNVEPDELVYADSKMLQVIFRNIISNAIKYTGRKGKIQINIDSRADEVEVSVKDNGIGMSKEDLAIIFDKNIKHSTLGTENEIGTGLGLALTKEFLKRNSGRIIVNSELGKGSEFKITLPKKVA